MVIQTEEDFITAFWHLYDSKPIKKISIRELCLSAGYHRTTFYDHFDNIYDLLKRAISQLLEQIDLPAKEGQLVFIRQPEKLLPSFLKLFKENHHKIHLLIARGQDNFLESLVKERLLQNFTAFMTVNQTITYALEYHISAILGVIKHWDMTKQSLPEEELLFLVYEIAQRGVLSKLNQSINKNEIHSTSHKLVE